MKLLGTIENHEDIINKEYVEDNFQETLVSGTNIKTINNISILGEGNIEIGGSSILDLVYPVGSIYMSVNNVSPAVFIGGNWDPIKDTFLLSAGDTYAAGTTGGSATHNHSLSKAGYAQIFIGASTSYMYYRGAGESLPEYTTTYRGTISSKKTSSAVSSTTGAALAGTTDNKTILPPYLTVYMWKRIP